MATKPAIPAIDESIGRLVELGFTISEARCYVTLLHVAPATAAEIADFSGVQRPKVYGILKTLERRGFCYASGDRVTRFRPVDAELALGEWTRSREHERRLADERDRQLRSELLELLPEPPEHQAEVFREAVMELTEPDRRGGIVGRLIADAERRVDIVLCPPIVQAEELWNTFEIAALQRGVEVRMLFSTRELAIRHRYQQVVEAGGEVRVAAGTPLKLIVRDEGAEAAVSLVNPDPKLGPTYLYIRHPDLVAPLQLLFNREWRKAQPIADIG